MTESTGRRKATPGSRASAYRGREHERERHYQHHCQQWLRLQQQVCGSLDFENLDKTISNDSELWSKPEKRSAPAWVTQDGASERARMARERFPLLDASYARSHCRLVREKPKESLLPSSLFSLV
jgi:hypothetical protein